MREADKTPIQLAYERRNRDLDPQLVWRGKDEQYWSDLIVSAPPLYIQEKVHPRVIIDDLKRESKTRADEAASPMAGPLRRFQRAVERARNGPRLRSGRQQPCYQKPIPAANLWSPCCKRLGGTPSRIPSRNSALSRMAVSSRSVRGFVRKPSKRVDYLLRYRRDFPLAVVEAKAAYRHAVDGLQQAKQYAEMLGLKFAYATNGPEIIEFDYFSGIERTLTAYPTPDALWNRYREAQRITDQQVADRLLTPFNHEVGKGERYYAQIAVNRSMEAILKGQRRLLLTMATGTGKTAVAFQLCWKLWNSRWNRTDDYRRPRILYLADRNILVDQPKDGIFAAFGDARYKIESGEVVQSREMYFAIYQALAEDERRAGLFKAFPSDFFDLVIVDECHRGSAHDDSAWRVILEHFVPAYQLGMTATPLRAENRDTYLYFGNPLS